MANLNLKEMKTFIIEKAKEEKIEYIDNLDYFSCKRDWLTCDMDEEIEDVTCALEPGGSEGMYMEVYLEVFCKKNHIYKKRHIFTLKTLEEGKSAYIGMGALLGFIQYVGYKYLWESDFV